jgi:hypothetical protein
MPNPQIGVRLSPQQLAFIDKLIESGEFGNRSEFVQYAVRKVIIPFEEGKKRLPPPLIKRPCGRRPKSGVSKSEGAS